LCKGLKQQTAGKLRENPTRHNDHRLGKQQSIGVITAKKTALTEKHLRNVGIKTGVRFISKVWKPAPNETRYLLHPMKI